MPSWQRRHSPRFCTIYPRKYTSDGRGNSSWVPDMDNPVTVPYAGWWLRTSRAEVPGQLAIDVRRIVIPYHIEGADLWAEIVLSDEPGEKWDIVNPPQYHWGTRQVRHMSVDIRRRP